MSKDNEQVEEKEKAFMETEMQPKGEGGTFGSIKDTNLEYSDTITSTNNAATGELGNGLPDDLIVKTPPEKPEINSQLVRKIKIRVSVSNSSEKEQVISAPVALPGEPVLIHHHLYYHHILILFFPFLFLSLTECSSTSSSSLSFHFPVLVFFLT